jgi:hypothetical protein
MPQKRHFHRRNLPHLYYNEGIYFITYRLYNSIHPNELAKLQSSNKQLTDAEQKKIFKKYDELLDKPYNNIKYLTKRKWLKSVKTQYYILMEKTLE